MTRNRPIPIIADADKRYVRDLVIHEDAAVLAFNKPAGLPSQTRGNRGRNLDHLLWAFARSNGKRPRLVHRLDTGTSGLILAGKTQPAAAALSTAFQDRTAQKTYLALVSGAVPENDSGLVDEPIAKITVDGRSKTVAGDYDVAKPARTAWRVISRGERAALLELKPETGRMHQIRVHLAHIGCPILGDPIYGAGKLTGPRLMLHAAALSLPHPEGGVLELDAPPPEDFNQAAARADLV